MNAQKLLSNIRLMLGLFVVLLILSGITAMPVYTELEWLMQQGWFTEKSALGGWMHKVWSGVQYMNAEYPFMFYGYDWLAFAHIVIGLAFIGPYKDPVRNKWVIDWAMLTCLCVLPLAFIAGPIRGIPWFHILIDCSFGIIGLIPLLILKKWIKRLEELQVTK